MVCSLERGRLRTLLPKTKSPNLPLPPYSLTESQQHWQWLGKAESAFGGGKGEHIGKECQVQGLSPYVSAISKSVIPQG